MTQFEAVLDYIKKMDIEMLDMILINDTNYQETSKKIFLEKLNVIFNDLKKNGNTEIELEAGKCSCPNCQTGFKKGYTFIGNKNRDYLELMFDLSPNEVVYNIYHCDRWKSVNDTDIPCGFIFENSNLKLGNRISFKIYEDEVYYFKPNDFYYNLTGRFKNAYTEIEDGNEKHIDFTAINNWLIKHEKLNKAASLRYESGSKLSLLYMYLEHVQPFYLLIDKAYEAVKEYNQKSEITTDELINWLIKYKELGCSELLTFGFNFRKEKNVIEKWYLSGYTSFFFLPEDFKSIIEFKNIFDNNYWKILEEEVKKFELKNNVILEIDNRNLKYLFNK